MQSLDITKIAVFAMLGLNLLMVILTAGIKVLRSYRQRRLKTKVERIGPLLDEYVATGEAGSGLWGLKPGDMDILAASMIEYTEVLRGSGQRKVLELAVGTGLTERYLAMLRSRRRWRRARAAENLGYLGGPPAVEPLARLLPDEDETVRAVAARALARVATPESARHLVRTLNDPSELTRLRVAENLERLGGLAAEPLSEVLESGERRARVLAARVLGNLRAPEARTALGRVALEGEGADLKAQAVLALGKIGDPDDLSALLAASEDAEWPVRAQAANALRMIGDAGTVPALKRLATDREWWVRLNAARALANLGPLGVQALAEILESEDRYARHRAAATLEAQGITRRLVEHLSAAGAGGERAQRTVKAIIKAGATRHLSRMAETMPEGEERAILRRLLARTEQDAPMEEEARPTVGPTRNTVTELAGETPEGIASR